MDFQKQKQINKQILRELRCLDYESKQKLLDPMRELRMEQVRKRSIYKENLYRLVSLIDQVEKEFKEKEFSKKLTDAVFGLSQEKQNHLYVELTHLESENETE